VIKNVEMFFSFKNTIPMPPQQAEDMYKQACSNDTVTVNSWREQWISNYKSNHDRFGSFKDHGLGKLFGINKNKPAIIVGSGPSLKNNVEKLQGAKAAGILIVSCLHNYQFMVDHGVDVDYYVSLDAGQVVIEENTEGGKKSHDEYVLSTVGKKLIAFAGSHPSLFDNWKGDVYLFNCAVPDDQYRERTKEIEPFYTFVSTGGNVLGASMYISKAIFGSNPIVFVGADFAFGYRREFHAWNSKYDGKLGEAMRAVDVWGNSVLTWQSYYNFKVWFDWVSVNVPGIYINCTEGGLLGSYPEGNIATIKQMTLDDCLWMYTMHEQMRKQCEMPECDDKKILF
jgi:hypothetical protein